MKPQDPERKSSPLVAYLLTAVVAALAIQNAAQNHGHLDTPLLGGLICLIAFWAGAGIDRYFR